jgi:PhnB protein
MRKGNKKNRKTSRKKRSTTLQHYKRIPVGFSTITPYLMINGAAKAIEFYKKAFGAKKLAVEKLPNGKILHARIKIGDSIVMMSDELTGSEAASPTSVRSSTVTLHLYSKNVDKLWGRAVKAGAKITMPIENQFWGERYGQLLDPFGHSWSLSMRVKMTPKEMKSKRQTVMEMFARSENPGKSSYQP